MNRNLMGSADPMGTYLRFVIQGAINNLPLELREPVESTLQAARNNGKPNLSELAREFGIPYAVFYERLLKGLAGIAREVTQDSIIRDWLVSTRKTETGDNPVSIFLKWFQ